MGEKSKTNTFPENGDPRKWWILGNVSVGTFMATLDGSIANVGLPTISDSLHVPLHVVQWVVTAYLLTICAMLPLVGNLADRYGRGKLYNMGFLVFALGSAFCGLSGTISLLIVSRIIQAVGASLLMANNQALVVSVFPINQRGRAFGVTGTMVSLGSLSGPVIGGLLIGFFGWQSIFWVNVPIGIAGFILGLFLLPKGKPNTSEAKRFDYSGSILFVLGIVLFLYTVSNGDVWGWSSKQSVMGLIFSILLLIAFGVRERFAGNPLIDFSLYKNRLLSSASFAAMLSFISLFCTTTIMPFYLEDVLHASPELTGTAMMTYPLAMAVVAPISGWLSDKIGPYVLTTGGLLLNALGFVLLTFLSGTAPVWLVALHLAIFGIGQGMFQSPNNSSIMGAAPRSKTGQVGGLNALVRNVGMVLGTALSVSLFSARLHSLTGIATHGELTNIPSEPFLQALHTVFWAAAAVCVLGAISSSLRGSGTHPKLQGARS
ncbi:DHA2 family efflux MFS transporter permease subunit [Pullulanibacillus sp. KACC 23026]|uniref:DHA2 family efflux MFS transporter permease subunit n=1 Tax=Pullulanibacillus sp. KACC 23026 TaxID=3028315 RepID=UPI0023AF1B7E|nr:DHA2 family efflux MFS transporter permease subunit [Pullulanibacillus sp. KACC 23026]WEG10940.1 DHA2 family efflux MFS transporter permease subunit [Pullulanibacillus sp. KACC 23026]